MSKNETAINAALDKSRAAYEPFINELVAFIEDMRKAGADPTKYYDPNGKKIVDLLAVLADLSARWAADTQEIIKQGEQNDSDDIQVVTQTLVDLALAYYTDGLTAVLPRHMTQINIKEILGGKPLGGDNAIFPKIARQVFNSLGMGQKNDIRRVIVDPVNEIKKVLPNIKVRIVIKKPKWL